MNRSVGAYEAKTHLPRLLEEVAGGATITITKHGVPVATLSPARADRRRAGEAADRLRAIRDQHPLRGLTIRELIEEGRR